MESLKVGIGLDTQLIGWRSGFGKKYFSFTDGEVYVNEKNVITSNSALYKNKKKHENLLGRALIEKAKAIMYLENDMGNISVDVDKLEYSVIFDDSIINDDASILAQLRLDVQDGYAPDYMYNMAAYKVSKEEALKMLKEAEGLEIEDTTVTVEDEVTPSVEDEDNEDDE